MNIAVQIDTKDIGQLIRSTFQKSASVILKGIFGMQENSLLHFSCEIELINMKSL
ncbi:hypothetical protein Zm00014a_006400 [Zea mays]|jgi:hypothetical protein|uniref:Uncharacterized protein n=1 Tax=Zea mays TaxID=4577 RepID=A0A3L6E4E7_MAIZE|nr:hypothetical protein Zm00014a_006400 [Zea mays]